MCQTPFAETLISLIMKNTSVKSDINKIKLRRLLAHIYIYFFLLSSSSPLVWLGWSKLIIHCVRCENMRRGTRYIYQLCKLSMVTVTFHLFIQQSIGGMRSQLVGFCRPPRGWRQRRLLRYRKDGGCLEAGGSSLLLVWDVKKCQW